MKNEKWVHDSIGVVRRKHRRWFVWRGLPPRTRLRVSTEVVGNPLAVIVSPWTTHSPCTTLRPLCRPLGWSFRRTECKTFVLSFYRVKSHRSQYFLSFVSLPYDWVPFRYILPSPFCGVPSTGTLRGFYYSSTAPFQPHIYGKIYLRRHSRFRDSDLVHTNKLVVHRSHRPRPFTVPSDSVGLV